MGLSKPKLHLPKPPTTTMEKATPRTIPKFIAKKLCDPNNFAKNGRVIITQTVQKFRLILKWYLILEQLYYHFYSTALSLHVCLALCQEPKLVGRVFGKLALAGENRVTGPALNGKEHSLQKGDNYSRPVNSSLWKTVKEKHHPQHNKGQKLFSTPSRTNQ